MLETIISFAMFSVILLLVFGTSYSAMTFSNFVSSVAVDMAKTRSAVDYIQRNFESAQRMQYEPVISETATKAEVSSISFKRSTSTGQYWTNLTVTGSTIKMGSATVLQSASSVLVDFYAPSGLLIASNHADVPKIPNLNDKSWQYFKVRFISMLNGDYFPITAVRKVSPYFSNPYVTSFTDNSKYVFSAPLDNGKATTLSGVSYSSNANIVTGAVSVNDVNNSINKFSSYLGVPAQKTSKLTLQTDTETASSDYALYFNGTNGYFYGSVINNVTFGSQFTIEMRVKIDASMLNQTAVLFSIGRTKDGEGGILNEAILELRQGKLYFWDYGTNYGFQGPLSTVQLQPDVDYHIAFVKNGINGTYYVNGQPAGTITATRDVNYSNRFVFLGLNYRDLNNPGYGSFPYKGYMDEVRIWNTARTQQQLQTYMNRKLLGNEAGLAAYWNFDQDPTSITIFDLTGNCPDGTINGGVVRTTYSSFPFNWVVTLSNALTNEPLANKVVYAYDNFGHFNQYITSATGSFVIGDYSDFPTAGITLYFPGDDEYAPSTATR